MWLLGERGEGNDHHIPTSPNNEQRSNRKEEAQSITLTEYFGTSYIVINSPSILHVIDWLSVVGAFSSDCFGWAPLFLFFSA
jgi:hypothetical protein